MQRFYFIKKFIIIDIKKQKNQIENYVYIFQKKMPKNKHANNFYKFYETYDHDLF